MIFAPDSFAGRHLLVTGASSGLGRDAALAVAGLGGRLTLVARDAERLRATQAALAGDGHEVAVADLGDADAAAAAVAELAQARGPFDGVFHSAGMTLTLPVKLVRSKHLQDVFGANVHGAFGIARACAKRGVLNDGGSMVFMSSVASLIGRPALSTYCAAKAAVDGLVRSLAVEFAPRRIRVNSIAAGAVETAMHQQYVASVGSDAVRAYENLHLLGFGQPSDVTNAALFLLSDASPWITGVTMPVDGGATAAK